MAITESGKNGGAHDFFINGTENVNRKDILDEIYRKQLELKVGSVAMFDPYDEHAISEIGYDEYDPKGRE